MTSQAARAYLSRAGVYAIDDDGALLIQAAHQLSATAPELVCALLTLVGMYSCRYDRDTQDYRQAVQHAREVLARAGDDRKRGH